MVLLSSLRVAPIALLLLLVLSTPPLGSATAPAPEPVAAGAPGPPAHLPPTAPVTRLLANDPARAPHAIADALVANIAAVPAGETIDVRTYWLGSTRIARALHDAFARGVTVRARFATSAASPPNRQGRALAALLNAEGDDGSWVEWRRGRGRLLHEKTWLFSRVGGARWVTVTGSYNAADEADRHSYALMAQVVGDEEVYSAFSERTARPWVGRAAAPAERSWAAYFLPAPRGGDPVLARLRDIPGRPSTQVRVAMYAMWGSRGVRLARELAGLARRGARVHFVAGPAVSRAVRGALRAGGVRVHEGCFPDDSYTHSKDMAATFVRRGVREHWTWVGSDNWTDEALRDDQAVLGLSGRELHRQFGRAFARLLERPDRPASSCHPRRR